VTGEGAEAGEFVVGQCPGEFGAGGNGGEDVETDALFDGFAGEAEIVVDALDLVAEMLDTFAVRAALAGMRGTNSPSISMVSSVTLSAILRKVSGETRQISEKRKFASPNSSWPRMMLSA
jgi:hypothetical protein